MSPEFDAIRLEIYWNRLTSIAEEQARGLIRTSFSTIAGEMEDLSCGVFDAGGTLVAQGATGTQGVLTGLSMGVKEMLKKYPAEKLAAGDVMIGNDPYLFCGHKYDCCVATPVFLKDRMVAVVASVLHVPDIGGAAYTMTSESTFEEGLTIPILKLFKKGELNQDVVDVIDANVRIPQEVMGDILAMVTANDIGMQRLVEFMEEQSLSDLDGICAAILSTTERALREGFATLPAGTWRSEAFMDGVDDMLKISVALTVKGNDLTVDFTGTSPQTRRGGVNTPYTFTLAYTALSIKSALVPYIPNNDGFYKVFNMIVPPGCFLNAIPPAPIIHRQLVCRPIAAAIFSALAKAVPDKVIADGGTPTMQVFYGTDNKKAMFFQALISSGGTGARPNKDGYSATCFPANIGTPPVEIIENVSPLLVAKKEFVTDSGGPGKYRGGLAERFTIKVNADLPATVNSAIEGIKTPAQGLMGGMAGMAAEATLDGVAVPGKGKYVIPPKGEFAFSMGGGGGCFAPAERPPEAVLDDVINGYVSVESARQHYKVSVDPVKRAINWEETRRLRAA